MKPQASFVTDSATDARNAVNVGGHARSYWDTVPASQRRDLAEQLLIHGQSHYPASNDGGFGAAGIKHPDCFWCGVGAHLDCDYDFLQKIPKQKLDEIASFARAFFRRDCYLPNNAENCSEYEARGNQGPTCEEWKPKR
ncbi:MAG TPA: hypothetical protein VNI77_08265 [Nitrososphaera sp.]|nr:hypothetical protein [Nitrososphaera sp.]